MPVASKWVVRPTPRPKARMRLLCFHHAGGGASVYRPWSQLLHDDFELIAVQLPGRENRFSEPPLTSPAATLDALISCLRSELKPPYALLGHSFGGLLATALAQRATASGELPLPTRLIVSAAAPWRAGQASKHAAADPFVLPDDDMLIQRLKRLGGTPDLLLRSPRLLRLFLPTFRADLEMIANIDLRSAPPLQLPISIFRGREDRAVNDRDIAQWGDVTTGRLEDRIFTGAHFYFRDRLDEVITALNGMLQADVACAVGSP